MVSTKHIEKSRGHEPVAATSLAEAKQPSKFVDPTVYQRFSWSSECPLSRLAALAHLRVVLKSVAKQNNIDPASAIFTESALHLSWKRPVLTKAAHAWFYRALLEINWKGGDGTWTVEPVDDVLSKTAEVARGSASVATSPAPMNDVHDVRSVFPTSPALKLLRGGDRSLESESRYELGEELGSGSFGTVFAAKVGRVQVAIKKYKAENVGQAKLDAAEVAVPGTGCYRYRYKNRTSRPRSVNKRAAGVRLGTGGRA